MTKKDLWREATEYLQVAGLADARFESELLLRSALGETRAHFFATLDDALSTADLEQFEAWLKARAEGEPLQYLVGKQEFMGLSFAVTPAVLIPRPDTEILAEAALELLRPLPAPLLADIGTGSGALAVSLAYHLPEARVWATDISPAALEVAEKNASAHGVAERTEFLLSRWGDELKRRGLRFHAIISNPPYVERAAIPLLAREVQREPALALDGGPDGLDCYRELVPELWPLLLPGGYLLFEVGEGQASAVAELLAKEGYVGISTRPDLAGIVRVVWGRRAGFSFSLP